MESRSMNLEEFWLETWIVLCLGHQTEVLSGGNLRRVTWAIRWVQDGVICECVCMLGLVDGKVLIGAKTNLAGSS